MKRKFFKILFISLLVTLPIRILLESFPDQQFWHAREILDFPGSFARGFTQAILYAFIDDPSRYIGGIKSSVNFLWLYFFTLIIVSIIWKITSSLNEKDGVR